MLVLVAGLIPLSAPTNAGRAAAGSADEAPVTVFPSLQVSPELPEVRPGVAVELTGRLSHPVTHPLAIRFEFQPVFVRGNYGRPPPPPPTRDCAITAGTLLCSVSITSQEAVVMVVRAWVHGEGAAPPDTTEGRLASLAPYPHPAADCRREDGAPVDDSCRGGLDSHVEPGRPEPDSTDVVLVGWTGVAAALVDCDDPGPAGETEYEALPAGGDRTVSYLCTVRNRHTGDPIIGAYLGGEIMGGPFDAERGGRFASDYGDYRDERNLCRTTAPRGHCTFDFIVPGEGPGVANLCLWSDGDHDGFFGEDEVDGGDCVKEAPEEPEGNDGTDVVVIELVE